MVKPKKIPESIRDGGVTYHKVWEGKTKTDTLTYLRREKAAFSKKGIIIRATNVGKSADPAYSDEHGYRWGVYITMKKTIR